MTEAKNLGAPYELVRLVAETGQAAGPQLRRRRHRHPGRRRADDALGAETVFVGSGIFKSTDPASRAKAIVRATTHWQDPKVVAEVSRGLGDAMHGLEIPQIPEAERLPTRGW